MDKLMQVVARATHGKSYNIYKYSYDSIGMEREEKGMKAEAMQKAFANNC